MEGEVSFVGRTSVEVTIEVYAENILKRTKRHTNTARVTMVAIRDGKPVAVPKLICEDRQEKIRFLAGRYRRELRPKYTEERERYAESLGRLTDAELDDLLK
jgi:acyl-CoA hydrolase